jgi:mercuric ion transport protein
MPGRAAQRSQTVHPGLPPMILTLAGVAAAFAVASCCALPLLLSAVGIGSAALAGLALIATPHRAVLLLAAAVCLAAGAALLWLQRRSATLCAVGDACSRPAARRATMAGIAIGSILLVLGYLYV